MRIRYLGIATVTALAAVFCTSCGERGVHSKLMLNEVLIVNESNYQDDYGQHNAWVEIFNKSYGSADLAGCFLRWSGMPGDTVTYPIPKGDVLTLVKPRQHALFWADGKPNHGTFHTNFVLNPEKNNWIGLYDSGNKKLDEVVVPAGTLGTNQSYARVTDASNEWEVKGGSSDKYVTPSTNNKTLDENAKMEKFSKHDEAGVGMAISAMSVVFFGLLVLFLSFSAAGKLWLGMHKRHKAKKAQQATAKAAHTATLEKMDNKVPDGEVYAAIAMALYELEEDVHDVEEMVLTIKPRQTAWSDKSQTLRQLPQR